MAIDNREKRQSVIGINYWWAPTPTPNASPDKEWRQQVGYGYSGIAAGAATPSNGYPIINLHYRKLLSGAA